MTTSSPTAPLRYRLVVEKRAAVTTKKGLERDPERYETLANVPAHFQEFEGSYEIVSARAQQLNDSQLRNAFLDYLYSPDLINAAPVPSGSA